VELLERLVADTRKPEFHYFHRWEPGDMILWDNWRAMHCATGTRPGVRRLRVGDRVAVEPAISCGRCDQCKTGRLNTCRAIRVLGHPGEKDGCLAELFACRRNCLPLPEEISPGEAMLAEPRPSLTPSLAGGASAGRLASRDGPIGCASSWPALEARRDLCHRQVDGAAPPRAGPLAGNLTGRRRGILERRPRPDTASSGGDPASPSSLDLLAGGRVVQAGIPLRSASLLSHAAPAQGDAISTPRARTGAS
jgi:hypothetical protein